MEYLLDVQPDYDQAADLENVITGLIAVYHRQGRVSELISGKMSGMTRSAGIPYNPHIPHLSHISLITHRIQVKFGNVV
jgi:hypothetical protein